MKNEKDDGGGWSPRQGSRNNPFALFAQIDYNNENLHRLDYPAVKCRDFCCFAHET